eukprot:TRINITY_DN54279_c0_g1_i2.p1 TRINITY_DN54279_c0_g1~~TRINITY_DN54279_c0_g1_i2.p1  ORF type:complete len:221 (+),score=-17.37 TRINITY_DN54279_c0_g1_i2:88-663(+)
MYKGYIHSHTKGPTINKVFHRSKYLFNTTFNKKHQRQKTAPQNPYLQNPPKFIKTKLFALKNHSYQTNRNFRLLATSYPIQSPSLNRVTQISPQYLLHNKLMKSCHKQITFVNKIITKPANIQQSLTSQKNYSRNDYKVVLLITNCLQNLNDTNHVQSRFLCINHTNTYKCYCLLLGGGGPKWLFRPLAFS